MFFHHEFCKESKEALAEFLEACKKQEDYYKPKEKERKMWEPVMKYLPPEVVAGINSNHSSSDSGIEDNDESKINDEKYDIDDDDDMHDYYIGVLQTEPEARIRKAYRNVLPQISLKRLLYMGKCILSADPSHILVKCYCEELLFVLMLKWYREYLKELLQQMYTHYNSLIIKLLANFLKVNDELEIFFLYFNSKSALEDDLLREFLITFKEPPLDKYVHMFENLVHKGTEFNSIKLVFDLLYNNAIQYKEDKDYGKLLLQVIETLGPQVQPLKTQIEWILSVHVSMWKIKLKKAYSKYSEDS